MPAISRQVGATGQKLEVFIPDATVSTGAGLASIIASSVSLSWFRDNMSAVSSQTMTTGTLGTWGASSFVMASSTTALGWYQVSLPDGVFVSGSTAAVHLYGAPSMAPVPILVELTKTDNQTYVSSQPHNVASVHGSAFVTSAAGVVATAWDLGRTANLTSTIALTGTTISTNQLVNVNQILGSTPVTTAAGVVATAWDLGRTANLTSTIALTGTTISTNQLVNVNQILGSTPVTTAAGVVATAWDLGRTANLTSTIALTATTISTNQLVNVNQILGSTPVTTAAGVVATAWDLGRTANLTSTVALTGFSINYVTTAGTVTGLNAALLDVSVSSRLAAASYTTPPTSAQNATAVHTTAMAEGYRASASTGTLAQVLYELLAHHTEAAISGTTKTINKIDQLTAAATYTLDSSTTPASITRAS